MRIIVRPFAATLIAGLPLLAGALTVEFGNPAANPEALSKHAVLMARASACRSPEKTSLTASAEGVIHGERRSVPIRLIPLSTPGTFALTQQWPSEGVWAVEIVARNPDYRDYATAALVRVEGAAVDWASAKHYYREPASEDVADILKTHPAAASASLSRPTLH